MGDSTFYERLKSQTHAYIMCVYDMTEQFPKSELYGTVSQLRRASVSIMLNHVEGHARFKPKVKLNFFEISYGSAKECKYLIFLAYKRGWISEPQYKDAFFRLDEVCPMLFSMITGLQKNYSVR